MGYKIVVSLHECNEMGGFIKDRSLHDVHSPVKPSIQEAFTCMGLNEMFEVYLECEKQTLEALKPKWDSQRGVSVPVDMDRSKD